MIKFIKNTTAETKTWCGQSIPAGEYYEIQSFEELTWSNNSALLSAIGAGDALVSSANNSSGHITDVNAAIIFLKNYPDQVDEDGAGIRRNKAAKKGWTYQLTGAEFATSTVGSLVHKDNAGNDLGHCTLKFYDASNNELTTQGSCDTDCVKTVLDFEPPFDFEIIGGSIKSPNVISEDIRIWVVAVPDIAAAYGGSKVMVQQVNMKFVDPNNGIIADGRVSKYLKYDATYHTNKIRLILKHSEGIKKNFIVLFELFKA